MVHLPAETLIVIFLKLNFETRLICKQVCKFWLYVLMNFEEFDNDRTIHFSKNLMLPINTLLNSLFKYRCKMLKINEHNIDSIINVSNTLSNHLDFEEFGFNKYVKIKYSDLMNLLEKFKNIKTFYFLDDNFICFFIKQRNQEPHIDIKFEQIESLHFKKVFVSSHFEKIDFKKMFPNVKYIYFDSLNINNHLIDTLEPYDIHINEIRSYCLNEISTKLPSYDTICKRIYKTEFSQSTCKPYNSFVELYIEEIFFWNSNFDVKYLHVNILYHTCFIQHKYNFPGDNIIELCVCPRTNACKQCLENLFRNLTNLNVLHIDAGNIEVDLTPYLEYSSKYCQNLKKLILQNGFLENISYKFDTLKSLQIINNYYHYQNQLQDLHLVCPKLKSIELYKSFHINSPKKLTKFYFDMLANNKYLVTLKVNVRSGNNTNISDDMINAITTYGLKLQVCFYFIFFISYIYCYFFSVYSYGLCRKL